MKKLFFAFLLFTAAVASAQTYKPAVGLSTGKKYTVVTAVKGNVSQEVMGQTMDIPMDITMKSLLEVKKIEGKEYQLSSTVNHIVMSMSMMGQDINYDSDKKEDREGQMGQAMSGTLDKSTLFTINHYGSLKKGSILKSASPEKDAVGSNPIMGMLNMDENAEVSPVLTPFVSDNEIKVGESFTDSSTSADGKDKKTTTYTLAEVKEGLAKFTISGTASATKEMEMQGMQTVSNTNTKTTGEMWVNITTGLLSKSVTNATITGTVEVAGMSIPITGNNTITTSVTETEK
jgi:hypothetical protein